jgi:hypothetical protein
MSESEAEETVPETPPPEPEEEQEENPPGAGDDWLEQKPFDPAGR